LRLDESVDPPEWKVILTDTTSPFITIDTYREFDVPALPTATTGTTPAPSPVFASANIVGAFPYKQSMVWLFDQGTANVQYSTVGNPENLYDDNITYDPEDVTQPAQFTLADDQTDAPIWGVQAGQVAIIVGK
jgi:hypothetical protein